MHCPKCGLQIESDSVSFCSRCGQTLGLVRAALAAEQEASDSALPVRRSGVNLGAVLMFVGTIPAILSILSFGSRGLPIAIVLYLGAYLAMLLGSGSLMKAFRTDESSFSDRIRREMRKEMAFGSTLMLVGLFLATCLIALLPVAWQDLAFIVLPLAALLAILVSSGWVKNSVWELIGGEPAKLAVPTSPEVAPSLETGDLTPFQIRGTASAESFAPPSITEGTTRLLKEER